MSATTRTLPDDMQYLKAKVGQLMEHTGLPEDEEEGAEVGVLKPMDEEEPREMSDATEEEPLDMTATDTADSKGE